MPKGVKAVLESVKEFRASGTTTKWIMFTALAFVLIQGVATAGYLYMVFWHFSPPATIDGVMGVDRAEYLPGDTLFYSADVCRFFDGPNELGRQLVREDGLVKTVDQRRLPGLQPGCRPVTLEMPIPLDTLPGVYHMELKLTYQVNRLAERTVLGSTEAFTVLPLPAD